MRKFFNRSPLLIVKDLLLACLTVCIIIGIDRSAIWFQKMQSAQEVEINSSLYVSPQGIDNRTCNFENPCLTYLQAESLAQPGDVIYLSGFLGEIQVTKSGRENAPITIIGEEDSTLSGLIIDGNYVNVYNVRVVGAYSHGILINSKHVLIENSIVQNSVTENGINGECYGDTTWGSGLKARVGAEHLILRGNQVFNNCGEGIAITRGANVLLENNVVGSNYSVGIYIDNSYNVIAQNNTIICSDDYLRDDRRMSGMVFAAEEYDGWGMQLHDNSFLNNTVIGCYDNFASWMTDDESPSINLTMDNNTSIDSMRRSIYISSINQNVIISNNILDRPIYISDGIDMDSLILIDNQITSENP